MNHFNKLTPAEAECLSLLVEEVGEVLQIIGKIKRHGFESCHPDGGPSNRKLLEKEVGDVWFAIRLMTERGDINSMAVQLRAREKAKAIQAYLHHVEVPATLL